MAKTLLGIILCFGIWGGLIGCFIYISNLEKKKLQGYVKEPYSKRVLQEMSELGIE